MLLLKSSFSLSSPSAFTLIFFLEWEINCPTSILLFPFITIISWIRIVLFIFVLILRIKPIVCIHHQLKKLSLLHILFMLKNDLTKKHKTFLSLIILYRFLQVVFYEETKCHIVEILLIRWLLDLRIEMNTHEEIDYFLDLRACLFDYP